MRLDAAAGGGGAQPAGQAPLPGSSAGGVEAGEQVSRGAQRPGPPLSRFLRSGARHSSLRAPARLFRRLRNAAVTAAGGEGARGGSCERTVAVQAGRRGEPRPLPSTPAGPARSARTAGLPCQSGRGGAAVGLLLLLEEDAGGAACLPAFGLPARVVVRATGTRHEGLCAREGCCLSVQPLGLMA